ncbi:MAG TPA: hypothetical protein VFM05_13715, partial [Candidatus Saccharimonadales bacterium]|nr:hypothetical protein [Candidatus Saccharimonadales bacterium]
APRRPPPMDGSSGPETKVHRGTATKARLPCFVRLICLPLRSILPLPLCFFEERERSRSPEMHPTSGIRRVFGSFQSLGRIPFLRIIQARPLAGNASRWALERDGATVVSELKETT